MALPIQPCSGLPREYCSFCSGPQSDRSSGGIAVERSQPDHGSISTQRSTVSGRSWQPQAAYHPCCLSTCFNVGPIQPIPYLFPGEKIWWLIGLLTLSTVLGSLVNPAWGSMMAYLVPKKCEQDTSASGAKYAALSLLSFSS